MKLTLAIFALVTTIGIVSANSAPPQTQVAARDDALVDTWLYDASGALVTVRAGEPEWGADGPVVVRRPVIQSAYVVSNDRR